LTFKKPVMRVQCTVQCFSVLWGAGSYRMKYIHYRVAKVAVGHCVSYK